VSFKASKYPNSNTVAEDVYNDGLKSKLGSNIQFDLKPFSQPSSPRSKVDLNSLKRIHD
jgi:hypothetical protein